MPTVRLTWTDPNSGAAQEDEVRVYRDGAPFVVGQLTNSVQAVEYWRGHYWLTDDTRDEVIRVKADGTFNRDDCPIQIVGATISAGYVDVYGIRRSV